MAFSIFSQLSSTSGVGQTTGKSVGPARSETKARTEDFLGMYSLQGAIPTRQDKKTGDEGNTLQSLADAEPEKEYDDGREPDHAPAESPVGDHPELSPGEPNVRKTTVEQAQVGLTSHQITGGSAIGDQAGRSENPLVTGHNASTTATQGKSFHFRATLSGSSPSSQAQQGLFTEQGLVSEVSGALQTEVRAGRAGGTASATASVPRQHSGGSRETSAFSIVSRMPPDIETATVPGDPLRARPEHSLPDESSHAENGSPKSTVHLINARESHPWPASGHLLSAPMPLQSAPHGSRAKATVTQPAAPGQGIDPILMAPAALSLSRTGTPSFGVWSTGEARNALAPATEDGWLEGKVYYGADFTFGGRETLYSAYTTTTSVTPTTTTTETARQIANQMASAIAASTEAGTVDIRLDPEELGSVQMSLKIRDGSLTMAIVADRPETLDLLKRHIEQLSAEFRAMGYGDVTFSFGGSQNGNGTDRGRTEGQRHTAPETFETRSGVQEPTRPRIAANGLDIRL